MIIPPPGVSAKSPSMISSQACAAVGRLATTFNLPNGVGLGGVRVSIEEALIEMYLTGV